jgi:DNA-binding HxlR family transcriptional regulator
MADRAAAVESARAAVEASSCSIARSLGVVGERWSFLILREAFYGATRFAEFRAALGTPPDVLTNRLATLVEFGVLTREPYQELGQRSRMAYHLTPAGVELHTVLGALQQWGDKYLPRPEGPTIVQRANRTGRPVHVAFVDDLGYEVPPGDVRNDRTVAFPVSGPRDVASTS